MIFNQFRVYPWKRSIAVVFFSMVLVACSDSDTENTEKWYTPEQAGAGELVYQANCASCHGLTGGSTKKWKQADENGSYPAPPLDGSAHSWHHSKAALLRQIASGGIRLGGTMPAFEGKLSEQEMLQVLAAVQSFWPEEIYTKWKQIDEKSY